jgi:hypothetical protein
MRRVEDPRRGKSFISAWGRKIRGAYYKIRGEFLFSPRAIWVRRKVSRYLDFWTGIGYSIGLMFAIFNCAVLVNVLHISWIHPIKCSLVLAIILLAWEIYDEYDPSLVLEEGVVDDEDESGVDTTKEFNVPSLIFDADLDSIYEEDFEGKYVTPRYDLKFDIYLLRVSFLNNVKQFIYTLRQIIVEENRRSTRQEDNIQKTEEDQLADLFDKIEDLKLDVLIDEEVLRVTPFNAAYGRIGMRNTMEDMEEFLMESYSGITNVMLDANNHYLDATNWPIFFEDDLITNEGNVVTDEVDPEGLWSLSLSEEILPIFSENYFICYYKKEKMLNFVDEYTEAFMEWHASPLACQVEKKTSPYLFGYYKGYIRFELSLYRLISPKDTAQVLMDLEHLRDDTEGPLLIDIKINETVDGLPAYTSNPLYFDDLQGTDYDYLFSQFFSPQFVNNKYKNKINSFRKSRSLWTADNKKKSSFIFKWRSDINRNRTLNSFFSCFPGYNNLSYATTNLVENDNYEQQKKKISKKTQKNPTNRMLEYLCRYLSDDLSYTLNNLVEENNYENSDIYTNCFNLTIPSNFLPWKIWENDLYPNLYIVRPTTFKIRQAGQKRDFTPQKKN